MLGSAAGSLESSGRAIAAFVRSLDPAAREWRPTPEAWSIHDVICHLLDEERDDFRARLRLVLQDPEAPWPKIDPQGWPRSRDYASRDFQETLASWEKEREDSLAWLRGLDSAAVDLDASHPMPFGPLRAGDLLSSWVAHDLLHLRQIVRLRFHALQGAIAPYSTRYAGEW